MKAHAYVNKPHTPAALKKNIRHEIAKIPRVMLKNIFANFIERVENCLTHRGEDMSNIVAIQNMMNKNLQVGILCVLCFHFPALLFIGFQCVRFLCPTPYYIKVSVKFSSLCDWLERKETTGPESDSNIFVFHILLIWRNRMESILTQKTHFRLDSKGRVSNYRIRIRDYWGSLTRKNVTDLVVVPIRCL